MGDAEQKPKPEPPIAEIPPPEQPAAKPAHAGVQANQAMHAAGIEARKQREAEVGRVFGRSRGRGTYI